MSTATVKNLIDEFIHLPLDDKECDRNNQEAVDRGKKRGYCQEGKNSDG